MDRMQSMRVFAKVVEQGGFARAARALNISNAVATRHVADLEEHLGARLLNRTTRKLSLTETGQSYLQRVLQILQDIDDAEAAASTQSKKPAGTLRIFSHDGFGQEQLGLLLPEYAARYPDVVLDITLSGRSVDLVEEGFDIGILINLQKFDAGMIARQLAVSEIALCASPSYIKKRGAPRTLADIQKHDCLNFSYDPVRHHWPVKQSDGTSVNVAVNGKILSNSGPLLRQFAVAGMGLMVRPSYAMADDFSSGKLMRLLPRQALGKLHVVLVYPSRRLLSAKVRSFVDFMLEKFPQPETDPWLSGRDEPI